MNRNRPTIGRVVCFRSRTGAYTCPAIVTATVDSLNPRGVEAGAVPALSSPMHVHLTVFTAGKPGMRTGADNFLVPSEHPVSENVGGCYQEWDLPFDEHWAEVHGGEDQNARTPGTWAWPVVG